MKQGQLSNTLVVLVALAVSLIVLLSATGMFADVIEKVADTSVCTWSLGLNAMLDLPPHCRAKYTTLTIGNLSKRTKYAKNRIIDFEADSGKYSEALNKFPHKDSYNSDNDAILYEFAMDEYIAKSLKSCWAKIPRNAPIFSEWDEHLIKRPVNCILCERIKFGNDVKEKFSHKHEIDSLDVWMDYNPIFSIKDAPGKVEYEDPRSYSQYLEDEVSGGYFSHNFVYSVDEPIAVLYARVNPFKGFTWAQRGLSRIGWYPKEEVSEPVNLITIVPYKEVGERCDYLVS